MHPRFIRMTIPYLIGERQSFKRPVIHKDITFSIVDNCVSRYLQYPRYWSDNFH